MGNFGGGGNLCDYQIATCHKTYETGGEQCWVQVDILSAVFRDSTKTIILAIAALEEHEERVAKDTYDVKGI
jgi:hypothetical protein